MSWFFYQGNVHEACTWWWWWGMELEDGNVLMRGKLLIGGFDSRGPGRCVAKSSRCWNNSWMTAERKKTLWQLTSDWLKVNMPSCDWMKTRMSWWSLEIAGKGLWLRTHAQADSLPVWTFTKVHVSWHRTNVRSLFTAFLALVWFQP